MSSSSSHTIPRPKLPKLDPAPFTLTSLRGVRAAGVAAGIKVSGAPDIALLVSDAPMSVAGIFTQNLFPAAPVVLSRAHLARTGGRARALVVNSGNANACTGKAGDEHARAMCEEVRRLVGCSIEEVLVCSTGVIGQKLPIDRVLEGIRRAHAELSDDVEAGRKFLAAIQTTDAFRKEAGRAFEHAGEQFHVAGICKGAGMIEPNMATMLAFVATDFPTSSATLRREISAIAAASFNAVHVDSHASTNDTFLLFSTGHAASEMAAESDAKLWTVVITEVARRLAWLIARDGEGASKVTTIEVRGARDDRAARSIAKRVATSALVRTALFGSDPNWGRFVSQVGNSPEVDDVSQLRCVIQGVVVFENGEPTTFDRAVVASKMASEDVLLLLDLGLGKGAGSVLTSDLGYRYVEVNAEYTT